jgi:SAM-dependent MidA family methyltransferase
MAANPDRNSEDVFKRANAYLADVPKLDSDEAIERYLKQSGIDISKTQEQAKMLVTRMIANRRLERAKARRNEKLQILDRIKSLASNFGASAAKQLQELIQAGDLHGAEMLARKFEESCPEDVTSLEEDLALLKEIEKDNGADGGK